MPITQDRLIALTEIANSFFKNIKLINQSLEMKINPDQDATLRSELEKFNAGKIILNIIEQNQPNIEFAMTLSREEAHFNATSRRNTKGAQRIRALRAQREETGLEPLTKHKELEFLSNEDENEEWIAPPPDHRWLMERGEGVRKAWLMGNKHDETWLEEQLEIERLGRVERGEE